MSKLRMVIVALVALWVVAVTPAHAQSAGCKTGKFVGSYTLADPEDVFGDGSVHHTYVFLLSLHADSTAEEYWTALPDYMINTGTGSPFFGSWGCRKDGKLVVTFLRAAYFPTTPGDPHAPKPDVALANTIRTTYLFTVTDDNTLTRVQARNRVYGPDEDPTDPEGGTLRPLNTTMQAFKRLTASDADLLLP
jgi:hypothetical protein